MTAEETPTPEQSPDDLVGQLDITIGIGEVIALHDLAAQLLTRHNEGIQRGYDVEHVTFRGAVFNEEGVTMTFTVPTNGAVEDDITEEEAMERKRVADNAALVEELDEREKTADEIFGEKDA